jgi:hypothetical protein
MKRKSAKPTAFCKRFTVFAIVMLAFSAVPLFSQVQSLADLDRETAAVAERIRQYVRGAGKTGSIETAVFAYSGLETPLGNYWRQNLISLLAGNLTVLAPGSTTRGDYILSGEIFDLGQTVRIFTRLTDRSNSAVLASWTSDLEKTPFLINLIVTAGSSRDSAVLRDLYEEDSRENPVPAAIGGPPLARTIHRGDRDWFLIRPETTILAVLETSGSMDTEMELYEEGRNKLAEDDDGGSGENSKIMYLLEGGKSYIAMIKGYGSETGSYQFSVMEAELPDHTMEPNNTRNTAFRIEVGRDINAYLVPDDEDWYSFTLNSAANVLVNARGESSIRLSIYDASGRELAGNTDPGGRNTARVLVSLERGTYYILVRGQNRNAPGRYTLSARIRDQGDSYEPDDTPESAKEITLGETQRRTFIDGDDEDWVFFTIETAGMYLIRARGERDSDLDTHVELFDQNLRAIDEDDDGGPGYSSLLRQRLTPGRYYLRIRCLDSYPEDNYLLSIVIQAEHR